jgi:hypothetical protein
MNEDHKADRSGRLEGASAIHWHVTNRFGGLLNEEKRALTSAFRGSLIECLRALAYF